MRTNLELKARYPSSRRAEQIARRIHARRAGVLFQHDIYYRVPKGRAKLRIVRGGTSELIVYDRPNARSARVSRYLAIPVYSSTEIDRLNRNLFGVLAEVRKRRLLYLYKNARIHIDRVAQLGNFVEFEVIVKSSMAQARKLMNELTGIFGIRTRDTVAVSYGDLLLRKRSTEAQ